MHCTLGHIAFELMANVVAEKLLRVWQATHIIPEPRAKNKEKNNNF